MNNKKPFIFIIDDEGKVTKEFEDSHGNDYRIESMDFSKYPDSASFLHSLRKRLENELSSDNKPDLILTDLKHEIKDESLKDLKSNIKKIMKEDLPKAIEKYNSLARPVLEKHGINVLRLVRKLYSEYIPVAIYSGTSFIAEYENKELMEEHLSLKGHWIQMNLGKIYESMKIKQILRDGCANQFILIIDGKGKQSEDFIKNHDGEYRIEVIKNANIASIEEILRNDYSSSNQPDIILTDFMSIKEGTEPQLVAQIYEEAKKLKGVINDLNAISPPAYGKHGVHVLEIIRDVYQDNTPVAIYTGFGIITEYLNSEDHIAIVRLNGHWFQKRLSKSYEEKMIKHLLER